MKNGECIYASHMKKRCLCVCVHVGGGEVLFDREYPQGNKNRLLVMIPKTGQGSCVGV